MEKNVIVILTAVGGHDVAARAIKEQFETRYKDCDVILVPMEDYAGKTMKSVCDGFYINACRYAPWAYAIYNDFMQAKTHRKLKRLSKQYALHKDGSRIKEEGALYPVNRIKNIYDRFNPKVIVTVQTLPQGLVVAARKKYKLDTKIVSVISDYALDKIYIRFGCDGYCVDNEEMKQEIASYGIEPDKIKTFGISAANRYLAKNDPKEMRKYFNLPDRRTVIVTGGSFGSGSTKKVFDEMLKNFKDVNIIAIAGRNDKLKASLERIKAQHDSENAYVFGYTTEFDKLLDAADVLVCKPGAMSVNEAFIKGIPVITAYPMPCFEAGNVEYFKKHNLALCAKDYKDVSVKLKYLFDNPEIYDQLVVNISKHSKKDAAKNISDYIYSMIENN